VSFWGSNTVEIFGIERAELRSLCKTPAHPSLPRCVLLHQFSLAGSSDQADAAHLLVGLGDGTVVTYPFKNKSLGDGKYVSLGEGPVCLAACQVDGKPAVFASGSRSTVCFWDRHRMNYSPVMLRVSCDVQ
jgi:DNA damage-binding protein 1